MQISLNWVNELVNLEDVDLNYLINKLTLGGFEVEDVIEIEIENQKKITLDISATANRSDSLSIQGISSEILALLNQIPKISNYSKKNFIWPEKIESLHKTNLPESACLGFTAISLENLTTLDSPKWLQNKLLSSGITPQNNFIDFQQYLLLETGYPFEFYDLDKLKSELNSCDFDLTLRYGQDGQKFLGSNDIEYNLDSSTLLVQANDFPISIGGLITNKKVECTNKTNSILIEGSIFNAAKIRQQSRSLGLRTDRSSKYEKSLRNINLLDSCYKLISLLRISNPKLTCEFHTISLPIIESRQSILLNFNKIKKVLGPTKEGTEKLQQYISPKVVTKSLERLNFEVDYYEENEIWKIKVPEIRYNDILCEIDLIEEVGRLYGFDNFLTRLPTIKNIGVKDLSYQSRKKLTNCLINLGLNELVQYSLVNNNGLIKNEVDLINPLVKEYGSLRSSLLPNLLTSIQVNMTQTNSVLEGFEYGHVFSLENSTTIQEVEKIAGVFGGIQTQRSWSEVSKSLDWFEAKGKMESLFKKLNIVIYWKNAHPVKEKHIFHPYCTADLYLHTGKKLGLFGQIHPVTAKKLGLSSNLYLFELNFNTIQEEMKKTQLSVYNEYSTYPKIIKDLSFVINKDIAFGELEKILYFNGTHFLRKINLIDKYSGPGIPINHTSLCLQFIFQSNQTTLENKQIEKILNHLKRILMNRFDAKMRT